jgi:hypothetical protein
MHNWDDPINEALNKIEIDKKTGEINNNDVAKSDQDLNFQEGLTGFENLGLGLT